MKIISSNHLTILILIIFLLVFIGCDRDKKESYIIIGQFACLTGSEAEFGQSQDKGVRMAVDEINNSGGLLGKKIELITEDNKGDNNETVTVVSKLINKNKITALIGEVASSRSKAAAPLCQSAKIPMITPGSTNPEVTKLGDYIFRVCFTDSFQAAVNARFAFNSLKVRRVALFIDEKNTYSTGLAEGFKLLFTSLGGEIVAEEKYSAGDKDFTIQLLRIKNKNPDAIFIPGYYSDINLISIQARNNGIKVPLFGGDGWDSEKLLEGQAKQSLEGCYFSTHVSKEDQSPQVQDFLNKFRNKYGQEPNGYAFLGYDAAMLLFDAIKRANSINGIKIKEALAQTKNFNGVTGNITMDHDRNPIKPCIIVEIKNGEFKYKETINP
ncbi:MAG: ABC transporter substrate-binding protein [Ignavibacteria bacterium]|nr:ABC transporter substrate-binding protein [Ignavibacteria bacterium]